MPLLELKHAVVACVATAAIASPGRAAIAVATTACANALFLPALKRIAGHRRPAGGAKRGYGMPSSHAAELSLILGFAGIWAGALLTGDNRPAARDVVAVSALLVCLPAGVMEFSSRVDRRLHTWGQTAVGAVEGASLAVLAACVVWGGGRVPGLAPLSGWLDSLVGGLRSVRVTLGTE